MRRVDNHIDLSWKTFSLNSRIKFEINDVISRRNVNLETGMLLVVLQNAINVLIILNHIFRKVTNDKNGSSTPSISRL